jgi:hypothetical protein
MYRYRLSQVGFAALSALGLALQLMALQLIVRA